MQEIDNIIKRLIKRYPWLIWIIFGAFVIIMMWQFWGAIKGFAEDIFGSNQTQTSSHAKNDQPSDTTSVKQKEIDFDDPSIDFVDFVDIRKDLGYTVKAGPCNPNPCLEIIILGYNPMLDPPTMELGFKWRNRDGSGSFGSGPTLGVEVLLNKGYGVVLESEYYIIKFEITDDRVGSLQGLLALYRHTGAEASFIMRRTYQL